MGGRLVSHSVKSKGVQDSIVNVLLNLLRARLLGWEERMAVWCGSGATEMIPEPSFSTGSFRGRNEGLSLQTVGLVLFAYSSLARGTSRD